MMHKKYKITLNGAFSLKFRLSILKVYTKLT